MKASLHRIFRSIAMVFFILTASSVGVLRAQNSSTNELPQIPIPLVPGAKVMPLWPPGAPTLRGKDQKEIITYAPGSKDRVQKVVNIHNPSIEVHLARADRANGTAIILAAGGGNKELNVGPEGLEVADWLGTLGVSSFILRYRLQPYTSDGDAMSDTLRSIQWVRANSKDLGIHPSKIGLMGFSAGGEQAAWAALRFTGGKTNSTDAIEMQSDRPDFVVLVYAGWRRMDLSRVPTNAPPAFLTSAGVDDAFHAKQTVEFYDAFFQAKIPAELHIYGHGGHGGGIRPRNGIPLGKWQDRFVDWATDLGFLPMVR